MKGDKFKGELELTKIIFPKGETVTEGGFTIASFKLKENLSTMQMPTHPRYKTIKIKGFMPPMTVGDNVTYTTEIVELEEGSYGREFEIVNMKSSISFDKNDNVAVRRFLGYVVTPKQLESLYASYENPASIIESEDALELLSEVKGFGEATAQKVVDKYFANLDNSYAMSILGEYNISATTINKACIHFKSPELAVEIIKNNPYKLSKIDGYSFRKCDDIYLSMGGDLNSMERIEACVIHIFKEQKSNGHTYLHLKELVNEVKKIIPKADLKLVGKILQSDEFIIISLDNDERVVSLKSLAILEMNIANKVKEMLETTAKVEYSNDDFEKSLKETEDAQGWSYSKLQRKAMKLMLENNVFILQGLGGTGKTTTLKAVLDYYDSQGIAYLQTALSGKASNNLALVTKKDGMTIHMSLATYTRKAEVDGKFVEVVDIPYDVVIIDEMSMVDAELFSRFLNGLREGTKLYMVGDTKQLESIGIPVMLQMVQSGYIPTITLDEVHRQAQDSAITMDSIAIRNGENVFTKEEKFSKINDNAKMSVHGNNKDLSYIIVRNDDEILRQAVIQFKHAVIDRKMDILDVQIITQVKDVGRSSAYNINNLCQKVYNPYKIGKKEVAIAYDKDKTFVIREGDKVINTKTDRKCKSYDEGANNYEGKVKPVYNGSTGVCEKILEDGRMVVNYEGIGEVLMTERNIKRLLLGYCITVHKSQGSENKLIIVALPVQYLLNSREMLYTAITRAREKCYLIGKRKTITDCIRKESATKKNTLLTYFIKQLFEIKK